MRESIDYDFETFRLNEYHGKWLPVGVVSYLKVKPRGGANAQEPDEIFRTFIVCTCNQTEGHHQLITARNGFCTPFPLVQSHQIDSKMHTNCALRPQVPHTA